MNADAPPIAADDPKWFFLLEPRIALFKAPFPLPMTNTQDSSAAIGGASASIGVSKAFRQP